jgi:hypothetical protein
MLPFTKQLLDVIQAISTELGQPFETRLREELYGVGVHKRLDSAMMMHADRMVECIPGLRSEDFEISYQATADLMASLYVLYPEVAQYLSPDSRPNTLTAVNALLEKVPPAPISVVLNDWLREVVWSKPNSALVSIGRDGFYLVRPNSRGDDSMERHPVDLYFGAGNIWQQFKQIRNAVIRAENHIYPKKQNRGSIEARMAAFA